MHNLVISYMVLDTVKDYSHVDVRQPYSVDMHGELHRKGYIWINNNIRRKKV